MIFVSLLLHCEEKLGIQVTVLGIEIRDFSTIDKIAQLVIAATDQRAA